MRHLTGAMVLGFVLMAGSVPAVGQTGNYGGILGPGTNACGSWTESRRERGVAMLWNIFWVQGYISATNQWITTLTGLATDISGATPTNPLSAQNEGHWAWIDNYCSENPLDNLMAATEALTVELMRRQGMSYPPQ